MARKTLTEKMNPLIVGPHDVPVLRLPTSKSRGRRGYYDPLKVEIRITEKQSQTMERETILHELLHALWDQTSLPHQYEEKVVSALSPALLAACRQNPKLREVLFP